MLYDTRHIYDFTDHETPEQRAKLQARIVRCQQIIRRLLPDLRALIANPKRESNDVYQLLRPYHLETRDVPMTPEDVPELEAQCRLILETGGLEQQQIQRVLLSLIGSTAAQDSVPFLLDMLHYSRRGDSFGPERRQLALWGLARIAIAHQVPEAYAALREGLKDRHADVRFTTADLILDAYLEAGRDVPPDVADMLRDMADSDPDDDVRRVAKKYLREPWAQKQQRG